MASCKFHGTLVLESQLLEMLGQSEKVISNHSA